jgi:hypothetical protein
MSSSWHGRRNCGRIPHAIRVSAWERGAVVLRAVENTSTSSILNLVALGWAPQLTASINIHLEGMRRMQQR